MPAKPPVLIRNTVDAWISPERPTAKFGDTRLYVHSNARAFLYFARPKLPDGAIITTAKLRLMPGVSNGTGAAVVTLHRLTASFDPTSLNWQNQPGVAASASGTLNRTSWYQGGALMEFNILSDLQEIVDGGAWYGFRLSSATADSTQYVNGGQSQSPMELVFEYTAPPLAPVDLVPSANVNVRDPKPTLSWTTPGAADANQLAIQVQVAAAADFTGTVYTSNEILTSASSYNLATAAPTFTALTAGQSRWWRVRIKNDTGRWSSWSGASQFTYQAANALTITAPSGASGSSPTPTVTWTFPAGQAAYQLLVYRGTVPVAGVPPVLEYDSGIVNTATLSQVIPQGIIAYAGTTYRFVLRVWDNTTAVALSGAPKYVEATKDYQWVPTGATPPVEVLLEEQQASHPARWLKWRYTGAAAQGFIIMRFVDGVADKWVQTSVAESRQGSTEWYWWGDWPPGRAEVTYKVWTVMASGAVSPTETSPTVTKRMNFMFPYLMSNYDPLGRYVAIVNADIDPGLSEITDIVAPVAGAPFMAQWALKKMQGTCTGELTEDTLPGVMTAKQMKANFLWLRQNPYCKFVFQDESVICYIYNCTYRSIGRADGKTDYSISFNFVEV